MEPGRRWRRWGATLLVGGLLAAAQLAPGAPPPGGERCPRKGQYEVVGDGDRMDFNTFMTPDIRPAGGFIPVVRVIQDVGVRIETGGPPRDVLVRVDWAGPINDYYLEVVARSGNHSSDRPQFLGAAEPYEEVLLPAVVNCDLVKLDVLNRIGDPYIEAEFTFTLR